MSRDWHASHVVRRAIGPTYQQSHSTAAVASLGQQRTTALEGRRSPASGGRLTRPLRTLVLRLPIHQYYYKEQHLPMW